MAFIRGYLIKKIHKFGFIGDLGTTEKMVSIGSQATIPYLAAASVVKISSTSVNDTLLGSGARTVEVSGVDANFGELSEIVEMDGQSEVLTTALFLRVFRKKVVTAGATKANEGTIHCGTGTVTTGVPAVKLIQIQIGKNQTLFAGYTIPAGTCGHVRRFTLSGARTTGTTQALITVFLMVREGGNGGLWRIKEQHQLVAASIVLEYDRGHVEMAAGTDIEVRAVSSAAATAVGADMHIDLVGE